MESFRLEVRSDTMIGHQTEESVSGDGLACLSSAVIGRSCLKQAHGQASQVGTA